ncbi:hypothetical protein [Kitasatospora sp. NPDC017646]
MTLDPVLVKRSSAAVESHGPAVAEYPYRHLFEHAPGVRGAVLTEARSA